MRLHHKDQRLRYSLDHLLNHRRRLMWYLRRTDYPRYVETIQALGIADVPPSLRQSMKQL